MNYAAEQRIRMIDVVAHHQGQVGRELIMAYFGVGPATATRDFNAYIKQRPDNLVYDPVVRRYIKTENFTPIFSNDVSMVEENTRLKDALYECQNTCSDQFADDGYVRNAVLNITLGALDV